MNAPDLANDHLDSGVAGDADEVEGDGLPEDAASMREVTPFADFAQGSGELENFASALEQVFGPRVTLYRDELPCEGCAAQANVIAGRFPDGSYGGFRAVTFWDH